MKTQVYMSAAQETRKNASAPQKPQSFPIHILREQLRSQASSCAQSLSRSVNRQTSYDALPCPEYREEVAAEYDTTNYLLYLQNCRAALESCIAQGAANLRYRWRDGQVSVTRFRLSPSGRVRIQGLLSAPPAPLAKAK